MPSFLRRLLHASLASQLRRNIASGVAAAGINAVAAVIAYPIFAHFLGLELYGVWLVLASFMQFALLGDLGVSHALTKLVAEHHAHNNAAEIRRYLAASFTVLAAAGVLVVAASAVAAEPLAAACELSPAHAAIVSKWLPIVGGLTAYALACQALHATLGGLGRMDLANYIQSAGRSLGMGLSAVLVLMGFGLLGMVIGAAVTCVLTNIAYLLALRHAAGMRKVFGEAPRRQHYAQIVGFGGGVFFAALMHQALGPINRLLICRFAGVASVPVFEIAFAASQQIRSLSAAAFRAVTPEVSRLGALGGDASVRLRQLDRQALKLTAMTSLPAFVLVFLAADPLLALWLDAELAGPVASVLRVLLVGCALNLLAVPSYHTLMGLGRVRSVVISAIVCQAINAVAVGLILLATGSFTPLLAAVASTVAMVATAAYLIERKHNAVAAMEAAPPATQPLAPAAGMTPAAGRLAG